MILNLNKEELNYVINVLMEDQETSQEELEKTNYKTYQERLDKNKELLLKIQRQEKYDD